MKINPKGMKDVDIFLEEAKRHLDLVKYTKSRIEEKKITEDLLEDKDFLTLLDAFIFRLKALPFGV